MKDGQWTESKEEIEVFAGGAVARQAQHQAIFSPNIHVAGAIDLLTADGLRFRSHILGLSYFDAASGQSVLIAETKDSIGELIGNQVSYKDAFTDFGADVVFTFKKASFEQDVILRQKPPAPEDFGLDPRTTRLEILTEFLDPPVPEKEAAKERKERVKDWTVTLSRQGPGRGRVQRLSLDGQEHARGT